MEHRLAGLEGERPPFVAGTSFDLATVGYQQAEYALTAGCRAYARSGGGLDVVEEAEVTTRLLVLRPSDPTAFDGTVVVEWLNVSSGLDAAPLWLFTHRELVRSGSAWVGVSAQRVGVHGGTSALEVLSLSLQAVDPERYGGLDHPGDRFSYDVFTAAGEVARTGAGTILEGLPIRRVLGFGESQSAFRLTTYVNDVDPVAAAFDGFLVHARGGTGAPLADDVDPRRLREGPATPFRDGLRAPVLCVEAETDLVVLGYRDARRDDGEHLVVWEMAGTSHADVYTFAAGFADDGLQPLEQLAAAWVPSRQLLGAELAHAVNAGPQHYVLHAAVRSLVGWVDGGARPPASPRLALTADGEAFEADGDGNALGGIRTPHVEVPVARLSGLGNDGSPLAFLAGCTEPFAPALLAARYGTRDAFADRFRAAADVAVGEGFLLADDVDELVAVATHNVAL